MGAQRWINLGLFQLQPSEVMKIALVLALARYFHGAYLEDVARPARLILPLAMILAPAALVLKQPDLGTALMLLAGGGALLVPRRRALVEVRAGDRHRGRPPCRSSGSGCTTTSSSGC